MISSLERVKIKKVKERKRGLQNFLKDKAKNLQKDRNLVKNGQILNIFEFPRHGEYDFFQRRP